MKNYRIRYLDAVEGENEYYSSKGFAIRSAVDLINSGKRVTVEDLTSTGEWVSDLSSCMTLEAIILEAIRENQTHGQA